jgi:hypothetical protein
MILLIQYKTVRLYTLVEHKNFSLAAGADDMGLFMEIPGKKPDCRNSLRTLMMNFPVFPESDLNGGVICAKKRVLSG